MFEVDDEHYALRAPMWWEQDAAESAAAKAERWERMTDEKIIALVEMQAPAEEVRFIELLAEFEDKLRKASTGDPLTAEQALRRTHAIQSKLSVRTAADKLLEGIGSQARSRYLASVLIVKPKDKDSEELDWDSLSIKVQNKATEVADEIWSNLDDLPFLSAPVQP